MFSDKIMYWISKPLVKAYTSLMLNMDVEKTEDFPSVGKIIAANHPTTTDPFFVAAMVGHQSHIMIHENVFKITGLGAYLRLSGHLMVSPGNGQAIIDDAVRLLKQGKTVIIFPEGSTSPDEGGFCSPRSGVARIALMSGAPVIPVGIHVQRDKIQIRPANVVNGEQQYARFYFKGDYYLTTGRPLRFYGDVGDHEYVRNVSSVVMRHIIELARKSENRMNSKPLPGLAEPV